MSMNRITILGSTGSIGTQTLDIIEANPHLFRADVLTAGTRWQLLAQQAVKFRPRRVVIADEKGYDPLRRAIADAGLAGEIEVAAGERALLDTAAENHSDTEGSDTIVAALVGFAGLRPALEAIRAGKRICLANKETLVVAGAVMTAEARARGVEILPVDSEHSAIYQCLQGEEHNPVSRIFLTASGGPFRTLPIEDFQNITLADALRHPRWTMGKKVTVDSASMMNKGFEMMEARWLFNIPPEKIQVVVHPQSVVHSMVEFEDGAVKAQLGIPDMKLPISYALGGRRRVAKASRPMSVADFASLSFETPDMQKFPLLGMAYEAMQQGGNASCVLNAANEVAVDAFLHERIRFVDIPDIVEKTMRGCPFMNQPSLEDLFRTHEEATAAARDIISL